MIIKAHASAPAFSTERLLVRLATAQDAAAIARYYRENRSFLAPFEPLRPEEFFTDKYWRFQADRNRAEFSQRQSLRLFLFERSQQKEIIGILNFNQFFKGPFQSCVMGYSLAEAKQGHGYMFEAATIAIQYVFDELNFHRVMANYMPHNQRSGNLLKRLGFTVEGYARDYLLINGRWADHVLTSLTNPNWKPDNTCV